MELISILLLSAQCLALDIIAHRGGTDGRYNASSMEAFKHSLENGVLYLESDMHLTVDNQIVLAHDPLLNGNPQFPISQMTLEEVKFRSNQLGEPIVTLKELATLISAYPDIKLQLEIKYFSPWEKDFRLYKSRDEIISTTLTNLKQLGLYHRVIISSFDEAILKVVRSREPLLPLKYNYRGEYYGDSFGNPRKCQSLCFWPHWNRALKFVEQNKIQIFAPSLQLLTHIVMRALRPAPSVFKKGSTQKRSFEFQVWTVNSKKELDKLAHFGLDGIITDYPVRFQKYF